MNTAAPASRIAGVLGWCSAGALVLAGCGARPGDSLNETLADGVADAAAPVVQVDQLIDNLSDASATSLTFEAGVDTSELAKGRLLASTSPDAPFLRRVVDRVELGSGEVTVVTEDVALDEAFSVVAAEVPGTFISFTPAQGVTVLDQSQSQRMSPAAAGKEIPVLNLNLSFVTKDKNASASVGLKLDMTAIMELEASLLGGLEKVKVAMATEYDVEVGLTYKAASFLEHKQPLGRALVVFWFGPVPVPTTISLVFELNGDFSGALSVVWQGESEVGGRWTDAAGWSEILVQSFDSGESKAQGKVNVEGLIAANWLVLGALGPKIAFGPFVEGAIDALQPCDLGLSFGLKSVAALEFGVSMLKEELRDGGAFAVQSKEVLATETLKLCDPGPEPPSNLQASATAGMAPVELTWSDNSDDEADFLVEWSTAGLWAPLEFVAADTTSYVHTSPEPGVENTYRMVALGAGNVPSEPSNVASVFIDAQNPPAAPTGLSATAEGPTAVVLTWTDNADNEDHFAVERAEGEGAFGVLGTVGAGATGYVDPTVEPETSYRYRVQAFNESGASAYSNVAPVEVKKLVVAGGTPAPPSNLSASMGEDGTVTLTWSDNSSREDGFVVERSPANGSFAGVTQLGEDATGSSDVVPDASQTYLYRVSAFNEHGPSDYSNVASTDEGVAGPNDEICALFGWCCADDGVCDSSWYACPEEDPDCALCEVNDGACTQSCLVKDPDCPSRELICGAIGACCGGDGQCDIQCPLSDLDPDCTNEIYCAETGNCCDDDEMCHTFCNQTDADCGPADSGGGSGDGEADGGGSGNGEAGSGDCGTIRYAADIHSETIRVVSPDVDQVLGFFEQTDRLPICESQTVEVYDAGGNFVGSFFVSFSLVDVAPEETPLVFIYYQEEAGFGAVMEYLTLDSVVLAP